MKITRIHIEKYGPLINRLLNIDPSFQCICGPNESGKTLIIDMLLKLSLGRKIRTSLRNMLNRVDEPPDAWFFVEDGGVEKRIDIKTPLVKAFDIDSDELSDIIVIRNSDLEIPNEKKCFGRITAQLMGLHSEDIDAIRMELRKRGGITQTGMISSAGGQGSPANQLALASDLVADMEKYLGEATSGDVQNLEIKVLDLQKRRRRADSTVAELDEAKKTHELRSLEAAFEDAKDIIFQRESLPGSLREEIESTVRNYKSTREGHTDVLRRFQMFRRLAFVSALGTAISAFAAILLSEGLLGVAQTFLVLIVFLYSAFVSLQNSRRLSRLDSLDDHLLELSHGFNQDVSDSDSAMALLETKVTDAKNLEKTFSEKIGAIKSQLELRERSYARIMEIAEERIRTRKENVDTSIAAQYSEKELEAAKKNFREIDSELKQADKELSAHRFRLLDFEKRILGLRFEESMDRPLEVKIDSLDSLRILGKELSNFVNRINRNADVCRQAIVIFDAMEKEDKEKVAELLSRGSRAAEVFRNITNGRYVDISYDSGFSVITAVHNDGRRFTPDKLSKGAKDQLYLAIRIALGERVLSESKGFFIMDDPFIASDSDRTKRQIESLQHLVNRGWQVLYFTAKLELAQKFKKLFGTKIIRLSPLE